MTASTGKRPRAVLSWIDNVPRTVTAWAHFLGIKACSTLRARIKASGSLEQAVKDFQAGVNQPFCPKTTKGVCKRGHKIAGDNIVYHLYKGKPVPRCKKCYRKEKIVNGVKAKPGRKEKNKCSRGLHEWTPENIIWKKSANGKMKRRCRACLNSYQRLRAYNVKMGLHVEHKLKRGQTVEERIAVLSKPMPNGCVIWTGKTAAKGVPWISHPSVGHSGRTATAVIWELMTGKPVPDGIAIRGKCGNLLCVAREHLREYRYADFITDDVKARAWKTRRARVKHLPHLRDIEKYGMPRDVAKEAVAAYQLVLAKLIRRAFREKLTQADVADITSEVMIKVWEQQREGKEVGNVIAFMLAAGKNRLIDTARGPWIRDRVNLTPSTSKDRGQYNGERADSSEQDLLDRLFRRSGLGNPDGFTEDPMDFLARLEEEESDRKELKNRLNQLGHAARRCYLLRAEGFSNPQVGARLKISVNTVEQHLQRVFDHLRTTPTGRERRALLVPLDIKKHYYGLNNRKAPKDVLERVRKIA